MENNIAILTDSTCDLDKETLEKYDIKIVPLNVYFGDASYKDGQDQYYTKSNHTNLPD